MDILVCFGNTGFQGRDTKLETVIKWNHWILRIGLMGRCQKSAKIFTFKVNSMSKIIQISQIFFTLKNKDLGAHFLLLTFFDDIIFKSLYFLKWCPIYDISNSQNSIISFDYCWFLAKNLSNFVFLLWKLQNRYCHKCRSSGTHEQICAHNFWIGRPIANVSGGPFKLWSKNIFCGKRRSFSCSVFEILLRKRSEASTFWYFHIALLTFIWKLSRLFLANWEWLFTPHCWGHLV